MSRMRLVLLIFALFLVLALVFGLGYLAGKAGNPAPIIIEKHLGA